jgi:hypothetical protein
MNTPATAKTTPPAGGNRILWLNVMTVISAAILIGAEVFGAAFAASWAMTKLFGLGDTAGRVFDIGFLALGAYIMYKFVSFARTVEPFSR